MVHEKLKAFVENAKAVVFLGGAGVSTESGIPDFRSADGIYSDGSLSVPPEVILSSRYFFEHTENFFKFYKSSMIFKEAKPNRAHKALAKLEQVGKLNAVITQNIDGLHTVAGSRNVLELHGSVHRNRCLKCGERYSLEYVMSCNGVPKCVKCGGTVKPDVVLYGEGLNPDTLGKADKACRQADLMIVGGTSLNVYPAASFVGEYRGERLIIINKSPTPYDSYADLIIREPIGEVLGDTFI